MPSNRVTIFSNGIADFERRYSVSAGKPHEISIPVKTDHIGDVLSSLNIFGPVRLQTPPSFRPANENETRFSLNPDQVFHQLATHLSGSRVRLEKAGGSVEGTLVGLQTEQETTQHGRPVDVASYVILTEDGFTKLPLREMHRLRFLEEDVQTEIDKALKRNFQHIKPESTFISLEVSSEKDTEAVLQYTIPASAWKMTYRIRRAPSDAGDRFEFQGFAIVDNTTDEDWTDFQLAVVTGEPITFSTDLADSKTPSRSHVNVVNDYALGAIEPEEGMVMAAAPQMAISQRMGMGGASFDDRFEQSDAAEFLTSKPVEMDDAEVQTVGDFCVFESQQPVTIFANRSAVIPMFQTTLDQTESVLHYDLGNHPDRAYRSLKFRNEMSHSLGRGVCTVYETGVYAGSCVVPSTPVGETCLLPHALETGVKVRQKVQAKDFRNVGIRISSGVCHTSLFKRIPTSYQFENLKDEVFNVVLDHTFALEKPDWTCQLVRDGQDLENICAESALKRGVRFCFPLAPKETLVVQIQETKVQHSQFRLMTEKDDQLIAKTNWLNQNLIASDGPLSDKPALRNCVELQRRLDTKTHDVESDQDEVKRLSARQDRLRKNLATGGQNEQTDIWRSQLAEAENRITEIEETRLPQLEAEADALRAELRKALSELSLDWQSNPTGNSVAEN